MDAARLTDARLLLVDLHGHLRRRATGGWPSRLHTLHVEPVLVDELAQALAQSGIEGLVVPEVVHEAASATAPWVPLPHRLTAFGRQQRAAYAALDALLAEVEAAVEAVGDAWRPLEASAARGGRFTSRTRRQSYAANVAAG